MKEEEENMVIMYESYARNWEHVPFNSDFLKIVKRCFNNEKIRFIGDEEHLNHVKERTLEKGVEYRPIKIVDYSMKISALFQEYRNLKNIRKNHSTSTELILTNSHPHTMMFVKWLFAGAPVTFVVHGSIEELTRKKYPWQLGFYNKIAFNYKRTQNNFKYIVLGESIKKNLLCFVPKIKNVYSIPHPMTLGNEYRSEYIPKQCYKIGTIGSGSISKGSHKLFEIEKVLNEGDISNVFLYHVGSYTDVAVPEHTQVTICGGGTEKLNAEDFEKNIKALDIILFLFGSDTYKLTASGALADAIRFSKPVIAIKNDYFSWVFEQCGNLGFLGKDLEDVVSYILKLSGSEEEYKKFVNEFEQASKNAKKYFSIDNIIDEIQKKGIWA